jgi:molybdate transport repressor ModE-like protein
MPATTFRHSYKEVRLQQLRSFCATARLGSLKAAAAALGLAQPTVWEQVHALERVFAATLIERQAHGCRLTESGRRLAELAAPLVAGIDGLQRSFHEAEDPREVWLTIAATERTLAEDLPEVIRAFEHRHPQVRLRLLEMMVDRIAAAVESGQADLGLIPDHGVEAPNPWLMLEPAYDLDLLLVTPADHPLAKKRHVQPRDLLGFPLLNSATSISDPAITAALQKLGVFQTQPRRVEAAYTAVIHRYVEMGFGIGLVLGLPGRRSSPRLHERSMSRHFGRVTIMLLRRRNALQGGPAQLFAHMLTTLSALPQRRPARGAKARK